MFGAQNLQLGMFAATAAQLPKYSPFRYDSLQLYRGSLNDEPGADRANEPNILNDEPGNGEPFATVENNGYSCQ